MEHYYTTYTMIVTILLMNMLSLHVYSFTTIQQPSCLHQQRYDLRRNVGSSVSSFKVKSEASKSSVNIFRLHAVVSKTNGPSSSLKSAAIPLLDAGKAFARTGELLIDLTTALNLYGGALSAVGAGVRNAGDNIAQAAASCRFKTANELVIDEIREAATSLAESTSKLQLAVDEAKSDSNDEFSMRICTYIMFCRKTCCNWTTFNVTRIF
jgi:hypothetical protein